MLAVLCVLVLASNASKKNCLELYVHELPAMKTSSDRIAKDGTRHPTGPQSFASAETGTGGDAYCRSPRV